MTVDKTTGTQGGADAIRSIGGTAAPEDRDPAAAARAGRKILRALLRNRKGTAGALLLLFFVVLAVFPGQIAPYNPTYIGFKLALPPSAAHWLGTTSQGQDIYSQLIWGTRQSLIIALAAGGLATLIAVLVGVSAAYLGGIRDGILSLITDVLLVIPIFPLIIVIAAYLRSAGLTDIIIVLGALGWSYGARQLRVQALSLRNRDFLTAASVRGERSFYIIMSEIMPTLTSLIVATFLGSAVFAVLTAAGLQFVGLGDPNAQSWGTMLYWAQNNEALGSGMPLWAIMPGVCIALLGGAFAFLNYAFDEISNPALRPVRRLTRKPAVEATAAPEQDAAGRGAAVPRISGAQDGWSSSARLLEVRGLSVAYATDGDPVVAVDKVDLHLDRGEFLAVVGESGCGKSTLMLAIAQLLTRPAGITGGSVLFRGRELANMSDKQLRHVRWRDFSVVMQSAMNALNPVMTIGEQMRDACRAHSGMSREEIAERSREVLRLVSIDPVHLDSYPHQLSGGMRQRSMIAMALLFTPDLVIMDEPTSALDVVAQRSLMRQIKELQDRLGFATIFVTHDISLVRNFSDRVLVMYAGQVAELGATSTLFGLPRHPYSRALLEAYPAVRGPRVALTGIAGSPPNVAAPPPGCRFQPRCADAMPECASVEPPLYQLDGTVVRCLLYSGAAAGTGSLAGSSARDDAGHAGPVSAGPVSAGPVSASTVPVGTVRPTGVDEAELQAAQAALQAVPADTAAGADGRAGAGGLAGPGEREGPLLEVTGLTRHFGLRGFWSRKTLHAVDDVSFTIGRREIVALVGESGSGKSTVARLLAMVYKPDAGEVRFEGKAIGSLRGRGQRLAYRGDMPMVFQDPYSSINPAYRVSHGIMRAIKLHRPDIGRSQRRNEAIRVLDAVGLGPGQDMLSRYPYELSGGQRQRIGFAQALALRPKLILADEPVSMLDVSIRVGVLNLMAELRAREDASILYITHDLASARYVADRVIVMYAGHVVEVGPTEQVLSAPRHPYTQLLLSAVPDPHAATADSGPSDAGEPPKVVNPAPGCRFEPRCPFAIDECRTITPQLGEVAPAQFAACHVALAQARANEQAAAVAAVAAVASDQDAPTPAAD
jgi:peptide/nickel transport system permease protein